jgi:nucleotide-binding universal stress UspA family protein
MNTILIATDFSPASRNASLYGVQLAKTIKAKVILFTAYQVPHPFAALNVQVSNFAVMENTRKKLADEADALDNTGDAQLEIVCEEGTPHEVILAIAIEMRVDLIIVGLKGSSGSLKKLFGSTATSLVNEVTIPVIIIPDNARFTNPQNVLYASDVYFDTTITPIDQVKWLTDFFGSKLFVVRVVNDSYEEVRENVNTPQNLRKELKKMDTTFHFPVNANTTDGLTEYIKEQKVDLVVMLPHKHEWIQRLFVKSETKDMAFHAHVPILMLPEPTIATSTDVIHTIENYSYDKQ